jgi:hypothetical protein
MIKKLVGAFIGATLIVPAALVMTGMAAQEAPCGGTEQILATIRTVESGNHYEATNGSASASGAYQMIDSTWKRWAAVTGTDVATYPSAYLAPSAAQDAAARAHVEDILTTHPVDDVPVIWYYPKALGDPVAMAQVPPYPGNKLTVAEYQAKWLTEYQTGCAPTRSASSGPNSPGPVELVDIGAGHQLTATAAQGFDAWERAYGAEIPITDSYRSWELQARRHAEEPYRFVSPEDSAHVSGNAVDVNMYQVNTARLIAAARATGWCQSAVAKREPWHFSFGECR